MNPLPIVALRLGPLSLFVLLALSAPPRPSAAAAFNDANAGLTGVEGASVAWGDYDNDGDLDALIVGYNVVTGSLAKVHRNDGGLGAFAEIDAGLPGVGGPTRGAAAWGDYDGDGDLDVLIAGGGDQPPFTVARVYRNNVAPANTVPAAPSNLSVNVVGTSATFSWNPATDAETPAAGLSYNLRIGTSPGAGDVLSPMADAATGARQVPAMGNAGQRTSWTIELPGAGTHYWSVQAVDGAYAGSPFAAEASTGATAVPLQEEGAVEMRWSRGPNPFSDAVTIRFSQPASGRVTLRIHDVSGRRVRTLDDGELPAGQHARTWDGRDDGGRPVPAGVYFARLDAGGSVRSEKITLLR